MVYLLHFDEKLAHAQHYVGFCERSVRARLGKHRRGEGSKLMAAVFAAGIGVQIAHVWKDGDRHFERNIKNRKNTPRLCPICNPRKRREK